MKLTIPACERNKEPMLAVLKRALPATGTVLEIAGGSGQHAAFFAEHLPHLTWQATEQPGELASMRAWREECSAPNLPPPLELEINRAPWPVDQADAVVCINAVHIIPWPAVQNLVHNGAKLLAPGAVFFLYGPFRRRNRRLEPSNESFDQWLRQRDPRSGLRELESVDALMEENGLHLVADEAMPANNRSVWWRKM